MARIWFWLVAVGALPVAILSFAIPFAPARAQTLSGAPELVTPVLAGERFTLASNAVSGRTFHIHVRLPAGYDPEAAMRYPVVYVLDGDSLFPLLAAQHLFMTIDDEMPEVIMVGIGYGGFGPDVNRRGYDYSMPADDATANQGGAPALAAMLRDELIPAIEAHFRAAPNRRILLGQSRGGHFALWHAFTQGDLFWATIASSPTMTPGNARFFAPPVPRTDRGGRLVVASGSRDIASSRANFSAFQQRWANADNLPWRLTLLDIEGGTHSADIANVYRRAMNTIFPLAPRPPH